MSFRYIVSDQSDDGIVVVTINDPAVRNAVNRDVMAEALDCQLEDAVRFTERAQKIARASENHTEALRAHAEKRRAQWKGR